MNPCNARGNCNTLDASLPLTRSDSSTQTQLYERRTETGTSGNLRGLSVFPITTSVKEEFVSYKTEKNAFKEQSGLKENILKLQ
ncbi:hypothetical protein FKM82_004482 [Ascaphus truei]